MCLIANCESSFIAQEDIQTYKAVFINTAEKEEGWYGIYFIQKHYPFDVVLTEKGCNEESMHKSTIRKTVEVEGGFFHSTTDVEDAKDIAGYRQYSGRHPILGNTHGIGIGIVCKATIPKGSLCYRGANLSVLSLKRIASTQIIVHNPFKKEKEK